MAKLTEGMVAKIRVPAGARDVQVFDDALPGFGVRKFDSGKASYFVKYSIGRQQRKLSLGPAVPGSLAEKRKIASEVISRARIGQDVAGDKRTAKATLARQATTLGSLVSRYLADRQAELRSSSLTEAKRYLERYWAPLHAQPIDSAFKVCSDNVSRQTEQQSSSTFSHRAVLNANHTAIAPSASDSPRRTMRLRSGSSRNGRAAPARETMVVCIAVAIKT